MRPTYAHSFSGALFTQTKTENFRSRFYKSKTLLLYVKRVKFMSDNAHHKKRCNSYKTGKSCANSRNKIEIRVPEKVDSQIVYAIDKYLFSLTMCLRYYSFWSSSKLYTWKLEEISFPFAFKYVIWYSAHKIICFYIYYFYMQSNSAFRAENI